MSENAFREADRVDRTDWEALGAYIASLGHALSLPDGPRQFAGGLGNWNYLVHLDGQPHVLRRPPAGPLPAGANDMAREYRILNRLGRHFPLAPSAPVFCGDESVIGVPFLLIEYREGAIVRDRLPSGLASTHAARLSLAGHLLDVLAQLHELDPRALGLQDLGRPDGMVARQARNWTFRARDAFESGMPRALHTVARWLEREAPEPQRVALLHSDYKLDNLILDPISLKAVALIDWDMGTLGDPLLDLATLLSYWTEADDHPAMLALGQMPTGLAGFPSRAEAIEMYARRSGLSLAQFGYYRILALFKLCAVFQQIHRRRQREADSKPCAASIPALVESLIDFTAHTLATERY